MWIPAVNPELVVDPYVSSPLQNEDDQADQQALAALTASTSSSSGGVSPASKQQLQFNASPIAPPQEAKNSSSERSCEAVLAQLGENIILDSSLQASTQRNHGARSMVAEALNHIDALQRHFAEGETVKQMRAVASLDSQAEELLREIGSAL